jgi:hypothetical protein
MSERKSLCVYTHSANGRVFYVGQGNRFRPQGRASRSRAWHAHVKAAGAYEINVVHWTDDRDEALRVESELIAAHPSACSMTRGPFLKPLRSPESDSNSAPSTTLPSMPGAVSCRTPHRVRRRSCVLSR